MLPPPLSPLRAIPSPPASVIASFFWNDTTRRALSSFHPPSVLLPFNPARDDADDIPPPPRSFHAIVRVVLHPLLLLLQQQGQEVRRDRSPSLSRASSSLPPRPSAALSGSEDRSSRIPQHWAVLRHARLLLLDLSKLLLPASSRRPSLLDFRGLPSKSS